MSIGNIVGVIVQWVVVPLIMLALLGWAWRIAGSVTVAENRVSAWAGFWAGLLLFVIFVVTQLAAIRNPDLVFAELPSIALPPLVVGVAIGFGIVTLLLSATSTIALFSYVFLNELRGLVLYLTLGLALGGLLHVILSPKSIQEIRG